MDEVQGICFSVTLFQLAPSYSIHSVSKLQETAQSRSYVGDYFQQRINPHLAL